MNESLHFGTDGWRAVIGDDFTFENVRRVSHASARVFAGRGSGGTVVVGYDTRFQADRFAAVVAAVFAGYGFRVLLSDRYLPTPALCWTVARTDDAVGGVILTASHNPAEYLGIKLRMADGGASPQSFTQLVEAELDAAAPVAEGEYLTVDLVTPYLDALRSAVDGDIIRAAGLSVVVDPMFGAGRAYLAQVLSGLGVAVVERNGDSNPGFGGLHPEPIPPWIDPSRRIVGDGEFDAAFFTDGDADRIGAADRSGAFVDPHRIIALVIRHLVEDKGLTGRVVKTLSTSVIVDRLARHLGLAVTTTPVGFKWIYEEMLAGDVLIGGEESGGIGIPSHVRERDGLLMALLLTEMMALRGQGLDELLDDLYEVTGRLSYRRVDLRLDPATVDTFVASMPDLSPANIAGFPVREICRDDGVKFLLDGDAWLLMRASGTEPLVRVYAEAATESELTGILQAGQRMVEGTD